MRMAWLVLKKVFLWNPLTVPPQHFLRQKGFSFLAFSVCSVYSVVKQPVLKLGLPVTFVHYPKVGIEGIVM